jgi:hypothetical protein
LADNAELNQKLAQALDFSPADLQANHRGLLTPTQENSLAETRRLRGCGQRAAYLALGGSVLIFAGVILFAAPLNSLPYALLGLVLFTGLFSAAILLGEIRSRDLKTGRISVAEGKAAGFATKEIKSKSGRVVGTAYFVEIARTRFRLATPAQFETIEPDRCYRIFYIKDPPLHHILSVEAIEDSKVSC